MQLKNWELDRGWEVGEECEVFSFLIPTLQATIGKDEGG